MCGRHLVKCCRQPHAAQLCLSYVSSATVSRLQVKGAQLCCRRRGRSSAAPVHHTPAPLKLIWMEVAPEVAVTAVAAAGVPL